MKNKKGYTDLLMREFTGKKLSAYSGLVFYEPVEFERVEYDKEKKVTFFFFKGCTFCLDIIGEPRIGKGDTLTFVTLKGEWKTITLTLEN